MGRKQTAGRHATNGTRRIRARRALTVAITALVTLGCCGAYVWADIADKAPQGASAHSRCPFHCQCRHLACHRCRGGGEAHRRTPREERGGTRRLGNHHAGRRHRGGRSCGGCGARTGLHIAGRTGHRHRGDQRQWRHAARCRRQRPGPCERAGRVAHAGQEHGPCPQATGGHEGEPAIR